MPVKFKAKKLKSNTLDWLNYRKKGVGASDVPAILGVCPYRSRKQIFYDKVMNESSSKGNFITDWGHKVEATIRPVIELHTNLDFPPVNAEHLSKEYLKCSLDGYNFEKEIVWEMKMVGAKKYLMLEKGSIPENFLFQINYQLFVTQSDEALLTGCLFDYTKKKPDYSKYKGVRVRRNDGLIKKIMTEVEKFWEEVCEYRRKN